MSLLGPSVTAQQVLNGQLGTCLYHCWQRLDKLDEEYPASILDVLRPGINSIRRTFDQIIEPILAAIRREVGALIAKLHRQDFGNSADPMAAMGGSASPYMKDLADKLTFVKNEVLSQFNVGDLSREWYVTGNSGNEYRAEHLR